MALQALLWDVDGTLAETERDGHRLAFNRAFADVGVPLHWDAARYGELLAISGGGERITAALAELLGEPPPPELVAELQARKQDHYAALVAAGELRLRPGVVELIAAAGSAGLSQVIVTTSGRAAVTALAEHLLGGSATTSPSGCAAKMWLARSPIRRPTGWPCSSWATPPARP